MMKRQRRADVYLTKSKVLSWLQCPRRLYLEVHEPDLAAESESAKAAMVRGNQVGEKARAFFPDGVLIDWQRGTSGRDEALRETARHLGAKQPKPIFEATFAHERTLVRADLLIPKKRHWNLVEVKSATSVKDYYHYDAAVQRHVLTNAGVKLGDVSLVTIDKNFVYPGNGCYSEFKKNGEANSLFQSTDVSRETAALAKKDAPAWIAGAWKTITGKLPKLTTNCEEPYPCPFINHCYPETTEFPVECLPSIGKKADELRAKGFEDIREIPDGVLGKKRSGFAA